MIGHKHYPDLKMYIKVPKKKQYYSQAKKKDERFRNQSVYSELKDDERIRLQTQHSQEKRKVIRPKYPKLKAYHKLNKGYKNF